MIRVFSSENVIMEEKKHFLGSSSCHRFADVLIFAHAIFWHLVSQGGGAGQGGSAKGLLNGPSDTFV